MRNLLLLLILLAALSLMGCGFAERPPRTKPAAAGETAPAPPGGHAAADVVPGSYEDWCAEHEVPETQCTRCDASLIAAFQAAGDWDADHGLPKSQCTTCDPTLRIVRPPKPDGR
jgi:hypothetical protein